MIEHELALQIARARTDAPGMHTRAQPLRDALGGGMDRAQLALQNARAERRNAGAVQRVHWLTYPRTLYASETFGDEVSAVDDLWTVRTWRKKSDESIPTRTDSSIGVGPYVPIGRNPYGGLDWNRTLLPRVTGGGVVNAALTQQTDVLLELLDAAGATLKTAAATVTVDQGAGTYARTDWAFDADGPIFEFYQLRATLTFRDTPIWMNPLNTDFHVDLEWFRGLFQ